VVGDVLGSLRAASGGRPYLLEVTAGVLDGRLWLVWTHTAGIHRPDRGAPGGRGRGAARRSSGFRSVICSAIHAVTAESLLNSFDGSAKGRPPIG